LIRIVFTSDLHFGLKKAHFRNSKDSVTSEEVNKAMVETIQSIGKIDYLVITGDITNREEVPIQSAAISWQQFKEVYEPLHIPMLITPGNHDVLNAIGYYKPMYPERDETALQGEYFLMHAGEKMNGQSFDYRKHVFNYSRDIGGVHFQFICIWPDSANRVWMENDLKSVSLETPVFVFTHDPPQGDAKHFTTPTASAAVIAKDKFENLLTEIYNADYEKQWDEFLKMHTNIKAYFHGHSNYQQFYTYNGMDNSCSLQCFRVDSPMKGKYSSVDESLLSFQLITVDSSKRSAEVKECFWNRGKAVTFGKVKILRF
jgi:hypothetical protein